MRGRPVALARAGRGRGHRAGRARELSSSSRTLGQVLGAGVAFHNADLSRDERRVIEEASRDPGSALKVIVATPTLAMGVNTRRRPSPLSD